MKNLGNHNKDYARFIIRSTNQYVALCTHDYLQDLGRAKDIIVKKIEAASIKTGEESLIMEADLHDFEHKVVLASHNQPVLVDFWADWCAPCHAIAPHIKRVVEGRNGTLLLVKVEVDDGENMKLAGHYRLRGFPTIMLFQKGKEMGRFSGSRSTPWIDEWLDGHLTGQ